MASLKEMFAASAAAAAAAKVPPKPAQTLAPGESEASLLSKVATPQSSPARTLGQDKEDVPYLFPSKNASPELSLWEKAQSLPVSSLGIALEPGGEHAWLAIQSGELPGMLLLHRLPLLSRREPGNPF